MKMSTASLHVLFWAAALQLPGTLRGAGAGGGSPSLVVSSDGLGF